MTDAPFWRAIRADCDLYGVGRCRNLIEQNGPDVSFGDTLQDPHDQLKDVSHLAITRGRMSRTPTRTSPGRRSGRRWTGGVPARRPEPKAD
jgi:hypothetical protein